MGTPMKPNYANLIIGNFKQSLVQDSFQKIRLSPLVQFRVIDYIFFVCTVNKESLNHFISFTQNYSKSKDMDSKIKLETHLSTNQVHFFDVTVSLKY